MTVQRERTLARQSASLVLRLNEGVLNRDRK